MYAFVGISGMAKMSSSRGAVPIPLDALGIMEAPLLRWLYARRRPNQSITVAFDQEVQRLYDEWDALAPQDRRGRGAPAGEVAGYARAVGTATRLLESTPRPLPYRTLATVADVTTGDPAPDAADPARPRPGRPGHDARRGPAPARPGAVTG